MSACPAGCGRKPRSGCYLCTECWYALPREQRREFSKAWRAYERSHSGGVSDERHRLIVTDYRRVRAEAVAIARRVLTQPEARA